MKSSQILDGYDCYNKQQYVKALQHYRVAQQSQQDEDSKLILQSVIAVVNLQLCNYNEAHRILTDLRQRIRQHQRQHSRSFTNAKREQMLLLKLKVACNLVIVELVNCEEERIEQEIQELINIIQQGFRNQEDLSGNQSNADHKISQLGFVLLMNVIKSFYGFETFKEIDTFTKTLIQEINDYYVNKGQEVSSKKIKMNLSKQSSVFYSSLSLIKELEGDFESAFNLQRLAYQISTDQKQTITVLLSCRHLITLSKKLRPTKSFEKYQNEMKRYMNMQQIKGISEETLFRNYEKKIECATYITRKLIQKQEQYAQKYKIYEKERSIENKWFIKAIIKKLLNSRTKDNEEKVVRILEIIQNGNQSVLELMKQSQLALETKQEYQNRLINFIKIIKNIFDFKKKKYLQYIKNFEYGSAQQPDYTKKKQIYHKQQFNNQQIENNQYKSNKIHIEISPKRHSKQKYDYASKFQITKNENLKIQPLIKINYSTSEVKQIKSNLYEKHQKINKDQQSQNYTYYEESKPKNSFSQLSQKDYFRDNEEMKYHFQRQNEDLKNTASFNKTENSNNKIYKIGKKEKIQKAQVYQTNSHLSPSRQKSRPKTEISLLPKHKIQIITPKIQHSSAISEFIRSQKKFTKVQSQIPNSKIEKSNLIRITEKIDDEDKPEILNSKIKQVQLPKKQQILVKQHLNQQKNIADSFIPKFQSQLVKQNSVTHIIQLSSLIEQKPRTKDRQKLRQEMNAKLVRYLHDCKRGQYIEKRHFSSDGGEQRFFTISKNKEKVMWSQNEQKLESGSFTEYYFKDIKGLVYGKISPTFNKQCNRKLEPWKCFSLIFKKRTFDVYCGEEKDLMFWIPGLSSCLKPTINQNSKYIVKSKKMIHSKKQKSGFNKVYLNETELTTFYSEGRILWKKFLMKIKSKYLIYNKKQKYNIYGNANAFAILLAAKAEMKINSPVLLRKKSKDYP